MVNGIPVIASDTGGTKEIVGRGGIVIKNCLNINSWIEEILKFDSENYYKKVSQKAKKEATKFDFRKEVDKVEVVLKIINEK